MSLANVKAISSVMLFVQDLDECQRQCFNNDDCSWYTYDLDVDYCFLTRDCQVMGTSENKVFGQKECYQDNGGTNSSNLI